MPKGVKKGTKPPIAADKFVTNWTKAKSLAQAAKWTGMSTKAAAIKAGHFRKKGVLLKKFEPLAVAEQPKVWTTAALNRLIKDLNNGGAKKEVTGAEAPAPGKKRLGRPKGSKNKKKEAAGVGLETPEKLTLAQVLADEDEEPTGGEPTQEEMAAFKDSFPAAH